MPFWDAILDPGKPARRARQTAEASIDRGAQYTEPYRNAGDRQIPIMEGEQQKLLNPGQMQSDWAQGYETSPWAQQQIQHDTEQGKDLASSMGLLGSSTAATGLNASASQLYQKDRQQYMDDLMKKYMMGIGLGSDFMNRGAQSANQLQGNWSQNAQSLGTAAHNANQAVPDMLGNIMGYNSSGGGQGGGQRGEGGGSFGEAAQGIALKALMAML